MPRHASFRRLGTVALTLAGSFLATSAPPVSASNLRRTAEVEAFEQARPSVVNIHGRKTIAADAVENVRSDGVQQVNGMGTGIVIDERGYIVTNFHVVEGVGRIQVTTAANKTVTAEMVAHDAKTDLAIIKIPADQPMPVIRSGTSRDLMTGEPVLAIGNAYGYTHTVTRGIISALHRPIEVSETQSYPDLIQTDASINPGNSGGPLLNIDGDMIGINVAVRMGAQGIGFALPVDDAMEVVARLMEDEVARRVSHGVAGTTEFLENGSQFVISSVSTGSAGESSGLRSGDVVTRVGDQMIVRTLDYHRALLDRAVGDEVPLFVFRDGQEVPLQLVLAEPKATTGSVADLAWDVLGLRLTPVPAQTIRQQASRYRGGLRVTAVRSGSPAAKQEIRNGDILIGLHKWETISLENIGYILKNDEFTRTQPAKIYLLRGGETRIGNLRVSQR